MGAGAGAGERERERERDRQRERERERDRKRQQETETDRNGQKEKETERDKMIQTERNTISTKRVSCHRRRFIHVLPSKFQTAGEAPGKYLAQALHYFVSSRALFLPQMRANDIFSCSGSATFCSQLSFLPIGGSRLHLRRRYRL